MSETSQGPGWWRAPDGTWYPPPPVQKTNGLAIASLVLSLLWIGGLGSLLSVIFGISSRKSIKRSQGQETGNGFATAGLAIGTIGVVVTGLLYAAVTVSVFTHNPGSNISGFPAPQTQSSSTQVVALKHPLNVSAAGTPGITTVTVFSLSYPVNDSSGQPNPVPGKEYAAADVQVCANSSGSQDGPDFSYWNLLFKDGQSVSEDSLDSTIKSPALDSFRGIGANKCVRGFLTFEIASGTVPVRVQYSPNTDHNYEWTLQG